MTLAVKRTARRRCLAAKKCSFSFSKMKHLPEKKVFTSRAAQGQGGGGREEGARAWEHWAVTASFPKMPCKSELESSPNGFLLEEEAGRLGLPSLARTISRTAVPHLECHGPLCPYLQGHTGNDLVPHVGPGLWPVGVVWLLREKLEIGRADLFYQDLPNLTHHPAFCLPLFPTLPAKSTNSSLRKMYRTVTPSHALCFVPGKHPHAHRTLTCATLRCISFLEPKTFREFLP